MARFQKGQSGNPGGRPKEEVSLKDLARARTDAAIKTLAEIMSSKKSPAAARVSAAIAILDRGHGKPMQQLEHSGKDGEPIEVSGMSKVDIARRIVFALEQGAMAAQNVEGFREQQVFSVRVEG